MSSFFDSVGDAPDMMCRFPSYIHCCIWAQFALKFRGIQLNNSSSN